MINFPLKKTLKNTLLNSNRILVKKKGYFVHIPKTAGNSVRQVLRKYNILTNPGFITSEREHQFASRKAFRVKNSHISFKTNRFPCCLDDPNFHKAEIKFTVVRNPFSLLYSYYNHYIDNIEKKNWIDNGWGNVNSYHNIKNFDHFIDIYTSIDPEEWHVPLLCRNLYGQILDDNGKSVVDYAIFFERLKEGVLKIINKSRFIPIKNYNLLHKNKSPKINESILNCYTEKMIKKVNKKCEWELDNFNYSLFSSEKNNIIKDIRNLKS